MPSLNINTLWKKFINSNEKVSHFEKKKMIKPKKKIPRNQSCAIVPTVPTVPTVPVAVPTVGPLIAKLVTTQTTILLFKLIDAIDKNNVFAICPLHVIKPNTHKVKAQLALGEECNIKEIINVTVCLFPVQHTFLDMAMGVVENPEVINNNPLLKRLSYLNTIPGVYGCITNKPAKILYPSDNGVANSVDTKILSMNYTLGDRENVHTYMKLPLPGGFILTDYNADSGSSGSVLTVDNNVLGIIVAASNMLVVKNGSCHDCKQNNGTGNNNSNVNYSLAVDMFYILPHINQCVRAIDKFTDNNPQNLVKLCLYTTMSTFVDDLKPVVNHLGSSYMFHQITKKIHPQKFVLLYNIHNFLDVNQLKFRQECLTDSIYVKTALNTNPEFVEYFFDKQHTSTIGFYSANYYDKVLGKRVDIDFVKDSINANMLDWSFRGDPLQPLILNIRRATHNDDGSVTISNPKAFTFVSSPTFDTVHGKTYPRTTMEIPSLFFNRNDALDTGKGSFNLIDQNKNDFMLNWLDPPSSGGGQC